MSPVNQGFRYFKEVGKGALIGLGILALIIGGFSVGGFGSTNSAQTPQASSTATASASPSASATSSRTCSVAELANDPRLAKFSGVVINAATDEVLFDRNANVAASTASVMKTLTAAALSASSAMSTVANTATQVLPQKQDRGARERELRA